MNIYRNATLQIGQKINADECDKTKLNDFEEDQLCHVRTDDNGEFEFPCVSPGKYTLTPFLRSQNIYFEPNAIEVEVPHDSVSLSDTFEV